MFTELSLKRLLEAGKTPRPVQGAYPVQGGFLASVAAKDIIFKIQILLVNEQAIYLGQNRCCAQTGARVCSSAACDKPQWLAT